MDQYAISEIARARQDLAVLKRIHAAQLSKAEAHLEHLRSRCDHKEPDGCHTMTVVDGIFVCEICYEPDLSTRSPR